MSASRVPNTERGFWEIAARVAMSAGSSQWTAVFVEPGMVGEHADNLAEELRELLEPGDADRITITTPEDLVDAVRRAPNSVIVIDGVDCFAADDWRALDAARSLLNRPATAILVMDESQAHSIVTHAPNLWSWFGGSVWRAVDDMALTEEQREERLEALRDRYHLTDEQVIEQARAGTLPPDPDFAEWLVLLGLGDLVGQGTAT